MVRINFQPYKSHQLVQIVNARLQSAREDLNEPVKDVIHEDGIKFAAMKVSSISGDARRVLDICRFMSCICPVAIILILNSS
jgi:origin recognition complex subunit 1